MYIFDVMLLHCVKQCKTFIGIWSNEMYLIGIHLVYTKHISLIINNLFQSHLNYFKLKVMFHIYDDMF